MITKTLISNCDNINDWTVTSGTCTIDNTVKSVESGNGSIKCVTAGTAYQTAGAEITGTFDLTKTTPIFNVWFDITNPPERFIIEVYSGNTKYARRWYSKDVLVPGMFWDIGFNKSDAKFMNGFLESDYQNITKIRGYFTTSTAASKTGYINTLNMLDILNQPTIIFRCDDGTITDYTLIKPKLDQYEYKANSFVITNVATTPNEDYMTPEQWTELYEEGWDIGSHTVNHEHLATLTEDEIVTQLKDSQDTLLGLGFTRSHKLMVSPYFNADIMSMDKIKDYYYMSGCGPGWCGDNTLSISGGIQSYPYPPPNFMQISDATGLASITDIEKWKSALDQVYTNGELLILGFHEISDATLFEEIVDYIYELGFDVITFSELYNRIKPPKYVSMEQFKQ